MLVVSDIPLVSYLSLFSRRPPLFLFRLFYLLSLFNLLFFSRSFVESFIPGFVGPVVCIISLLFFISAPSVISVDLLSPLSLLHPLPLFSLLSS